MSFLVSIISILSISVSLNAAEREGPSADDVLWTVSKAMSELTRSNTSPYELDNLPILKGLLTFTILDDRIKRNNNFGSADQDVEMFSRALEGRGYLSPAIWDHLKNISPLGNDYGKFRNVPQKIQFARAISEKADWPKWVWDLTPFFLNSESEGTKDVLYFENGVRFQKEIPLSFWQKYIELMLTTPYFQKNGGHVLRGRLWPMELVLKLPAILSAHPEADPRTVLQSLFAMGNMSQIHYTYTKKWTPEMWQILPNLLKQSTRTRDVALANLLHYPGKVPQEIRSLLVEASKGSVVCESILYKLN